MNGIMKKLLLGVAAICGGTHASIACTGISLTAADNSYVQARTIEWAYGALKSEYVVIPRGEKLQSYTPTGMNGMLYTARYGTVGLAVVEREFIAEGIGAQSTVCGGGRYDGLVSSLGGPELPGIGFAMGITRLILAMREMGLDNIEEKKPVLYIASLHADFRAIRYSSSVRSRRGLHRRSERR